MQKTEFSNGFYAELHDENPNSAKILRLYTPDDVCVASLPITGKDFAGCAEMLMYGYFAGFADAKRKIRKEMTGILDRIGIVDVQR